MPDLDILLTPYRLNALSVPNRVVMAPMTRSFSPCGIPTADVAAYYRRRAAHGVGLFITEGTGVGRASALASRSGCRATRLRQPAGSPRFLKSTQT